MDCCLYALPAPLLISCVQVLPHGTGGTKAEYREMKSYISCAGHGKVHAAASALSLIVPRMVSIKRFRATIMGWRLAEHNGDMTRVVVWQFVDGAYYIP